MHPKPEYIVLPQTILFFVHEAAGIVDTWMKMKGHKNWVLGGICSRAFADQVLTINKKPCENCEGLGYVIEEYSRCTCVHCDGKGS